MKCLARCYGKDRKGVLHADAPSMTTILARALLLTVFVTAAVVYQSQNDKAEAANALKTGASSRVDLEVINRHFTVGEKIRSLYLRVFV